MSRVPPPSPTYIGPPRNHGGSGNKPVHRVVIHSAVWKCEEGAARAIARYFAQTDRDASAHYCTDPSETIQSAWDDIVCYAAPPNEHTIHIEMADWPGPVPDEEPGSARWKALRRSWRWAKPSQRRMLDRTAYLTARLCLAYDVPVRYRTAKQLRAGGYHGSDLSARGWTTHRQVSKAWGQTVHWDPGWWPRRWFDRRVRKHAANLEEEYR
jgi:hypothetical protein